MTSSFHHKILSYLLSIVLVAVTMPLQSGALVMGQQQQEPPAPRLLRNTQGRARR